MIISAVIVDGSQRVRRLDASRSHPRSLDAVDANEKPVLEWVIHALRQSGVEDSIYVGGYHIEKIIERFPTLRVAYHAKSDREGEVGALLCCSRPSSSLLIARASTLLLPDVIARMSGCKVARGIYGEGRSAGVYFVDASLIEATFETAGAMLAGDGAVDLDALFGILPGVEAVDLDGCAAPAADQEAIARTIFRGKAQTLDNLAPLVRGAHVLPRVRISVAEWNRSRSDAMHLVKAAFAGQIVIVRSSASSEDGLNASSAGRYLTYPHVSVDDDHELSVAIDAVVASYVEEDRSIDPRDEVLIQPQLSGVQASGVMLTRDPRTGAPYYVINEDRLSGRSDAVTSGGAGTIEQSFIAWTEANKASLRDDTRRLLDLGEELMRLSHLDALDIEYAISQDGVCHLLQVRPLAAARRSPLVADEDVLALISGTRQFVSERMRPLTPLAGSTTVFGVMPDWNPAEMIGTAPRPLALSLYQLLIGSDAWAEARRRIGYRDVRPEPLVVALGGRPYIDVRASLNSFLPAALDDLSAEVWVDACLQRLRDNPALHDKVEFELAITCLAPDWDEAAVRLDLAGVDRKKFIEPLRDVTIAMLCETKEPIAEQLAIVDRMNARRERHLAQPDAGVHGAARLILHLLDDCRCLGLVPFSILARYAFVSMSFLRGFLQTGVIDEALYHQFLRAIPTVAGAIADDLGSDLPLEVLSERYGHLRPNSYEITAPNYARNPAQFLKAPPQAAASGNEADAEAILLSRGPQIEKSLEALGIDMDARQLAKFMVASIAGRERCKFEFMKNLNAALEQIAVLGQQLGLDREQMSLLAISDIMRFATDSMVQADVSQLARRSAYNEKRWSATQALHLSDLITDPDEVGAFRLAAWRPNFVTRNRVVAPAVWLEGAQPHADLRGVIVVMRAADPGYDWIFAHKIAGLVTEYGGVASHMSIRAAEFGLPAAIGCGSAIMNTLLGASTIELDCNAERVRPVS